MCGIIAWMGDISVPEIITRKQAIECGITFYFTGKPCKRGHLAERRVGNKACRECEAQQRALHNPAYHAKNRDKILERQRKWRRQNAERVAAHREKTRPRRRAQKRNWYKNNPSKANAMAARRRAARLQRTPAWADPQAIARFYAQARLMTIVTGWPHHVDHIVPLRGRSVCGLHVESNLQILPDDENIEKSNKFEV